MIELMLLTSRLVVLVAFAYIVSVVSGFPIWNQEQLCPTLELGSSTRPSPCVSPWVVNTLSGLLANLQGISLVLRYYVLKHHNNATHHISDARFICVPTVFQTSDMHSKIRHKSVHITIPPHPM